MVKIAVAGGSGNVATELLRGVLASGHHTVTILSRSAQPPASSQQPGVDYMQVDYASVSSLTDALKGYDVCLSFLILPSPDGFQNQNNLIEACIAANVRRFAPSEWAIKCNSGVSTYRNKDLTAEHLSKLKQQGMAMEYTLFQPSIWMDYFAHPFPLSPNLITWTFFIDFENRRAMILDDGNQPLVVTAISDVSNILALALDDPQPWPAVGGIQGAKTTINELVALGKKIRGGEWNIEHVKGEDIQNGVLKTSWIPQFTHPAIPEEIREAFSKEFVTDFFKAIMSGAWNVSDEFNKRYPDYKFRDLEEYLTEAWAGRP